jgi:hypothetical protein
VIEADKYLSALLLQFSLPAIEADKYLSAVFLQFSLRVIEADKYLEFSLRVTEAPYY